MSIKCRGFIFYELLISMLIILIIVQFIVVLNYQIKQNFENEQLNYEMKQIFYLNLYYIENNIELTQGDEYFLYYDHISLCIEWTDLYEKQKVYCEKYWI